MPSTWLCYIRTRGLSNAQCNFIKIWSNVFKTIGCIRLDLFPTYISTNPLPAHAPSKWHCRTNIALTMYQYIWDAVSYIHDIYYLDIYEHWLTNNWYILIGSILLKSKSNWRVHDLKRGLSVVHGYLEDTVYMFKRARKYLICFNISPRLTHRTDLVYIVFGKNVSLDPGCFEKTLWVLKSERS